MSNKNSSLILAFASAVFSSDADDNLIRVPAQRQVRKTARSDERTISFEVPKLKVSVLDFAIEQARAKAQIPSRHVTKTKNADGSVTETEKISDVLTDEVMAEFNRTSEDATEAYLTKGNLMDYVGSHIYGVSTDRVTESKLHKDIDATKSQLGEFVYELKVVGWNATTAAKLSVPDEEAANAQQANICVRLAGLIGQLEELIQVKALREAKALAKK